MWNIIEEKMRSYLEFWHGKPDDAKRQYQYYRCEGCKNLVTWNVIHRGGCDCGLSNRIRPARIRTHEKVRLLLAPWSV